MIEVLRYALDDGRVPFNEWFDGLRDTELKGRVQFRLRQLQLGNWGDWASVGGGVYEMRIHLGSGHRIYCGRHGDSMVILLCGGSKSARQQSDILLARRFWIDWKRRYK